MSAPLLPPATAPAPAPSTAPAPAPTAAPVPVFEAHPPAASVSAIAAIPQVILVYMAAPISRSGKLWVVRMAPQAAVHGAGALPTAVRRAAAVQVLEQVEAGLAGADQVQVAVAVDVHRFDVQPGAGRAAGEV